MRAQHQPTIFDAIASQEARETGMNQAAGNKASLLKYARQIAVEVAKRKGSISADDVQFELHRHGISVKALGNAAGSIFSDKKVWQFTGEFVTSTRVHAHGNLLRTWRLRNTLCTTNATDAL